MMTDIYGIIKTFGAAVMTAAAAFVISACSMEESGPNPVEEGRPVEATLSFSSNDITETVVTKSNSYSRLASLILFIYNADGRKCEQIVETADGSLVLDGSATNSEGIVYTAKFTTTTGTKRICALGNYESDNNWEYYDMSGIGTDGFDPENPDRWGNFSEYVSALKEGAGNGMSSAELGRSLFFLEREFSQRGNTPTFDEQQMIMTGADVVTIGIDGTVTGESQDNPDGNLYLERCIADIQFKIAQEYINQDNHHTVTFSASNYYVYNIAGGTRLAPGRGIETNPNESYREFYFDGSRKPISPAAGGEYSFQFFVPENIQETLTTGTDESGEQFDFTTEGGYQLREKWEGYDTYPGKETHKLWKNAPLNATYVVIEGQYSEMDSDNNLVYTGAVSYTIHLGNFGPGRWGDFTIERNHRYIYNVTVHGINSIEVEATTDVENQPGAEGSIVSTSETTKNYALDAHYEQVLLEYDLSAIAEAARATQDANTGMSDAEAISEHLIVTVDTPFQDGLKEIRPYRTFMQYYSGSNYQDALKKAKEEDLADADYKWVEFWPQTADGTDLEAYPGLPSWKNASGQDARENSKYLLDVYDACVKMGQVVEKIMNGRDLTYYEDGWYGGSGVREESKDDGRGITVFRVRTGGTTWNPSYSYYARFTGFVDEYYYTSNPITGGAITWGDFANMPQRRMLISMDVQTSADGNSSFSNVHTNISQRSMQTFYNTDAATGLNAFGLETFNETPLSSYGSPKANGTSDTDGRSNQRALIGTYYGWNYYINTGSNGYTDNVTGTRKLTEAYRQGTSDRNNTVRAYSACLSRNRDLDGDNSIDDDEIRWYLPAINEYLRIGMGTIAMSNESNLYIGDKSQMQRGPDNNGDGWPDNDNWYPDNYYNNGALYHTSTNGKQTFWAVEKGAYGGVTSGNIPIRCIRHLPADLEDNSIPADPMFDLYTIANGSHLLDFRGKFDNNMYRPTRTDTHLNEHNEDDLQNRFYDGLVISRTAQTNTAKLEAILNIGNNQTNPCADYYEGSENDPVSGKGHWRVPNLAELTVMASNPDVLLTGYNQIPYLYCCTRFSNEKVRIAFRFDGTQISCLGDKGERVDGDYQERYRCVRDATDRDFAEARPVY